MKVVLVDYGVGNLLSVSRALAACGGEVDQTGDPGRVANADRLVLPGVGAFGDCMAELLRRGLGDPVRQFARTGRPMLGICVGMQILFDTGEEFGTHAGLGLLPGTVIAIPPTTDSGERRKIPHIGWNALRPEAGGDWRGSILADVAPGESVYFVHSYAARPAENRDLLAAADYDGCSITAAVGRDNLSGCQFHPEKSGPVGLRILTRFLAR
jgi:imidazole glycerol-phosphate synthase subunit HisH